MFRPLFFLYFFLSIPLSVIAQNPLITDRPGEGTDAPGVVAPGFVQLESGFFFQRDQVEGGERATLIKLPTSLFRIGVLDNFELRVSRDILSDGEETGVGPLNFGTKIGIAQEKKVLPTLALLASLTLPSSGSEAYENRFAQPSFKLLINKTITDFLAFTINLGAQWENDQPQAVYTYAWSFDMSLSDNMGAFVEFYGFMPEESNNDHLLNYGFVYLLSPNLQLDLSSGVAFNAQAPDYFVGAGVSWRVDFFPNQ